MSIEKKFLSNDFIHYFDEYKLNKNLDQIDCFNSEIIDDIENIINKNKNSSYSIVLGIKSGNYDFQPDKINVCIDLLFEEIKQKISNKGL